MCVSLLCLLIPRGARQHSGGFCRPAFLATLLSPYLTTCRPRRLTRFPCASLLSLTLEPSVQF